MAAPRGMMRLARKGRKDIIETLCRRLAALDRQLANTSQLDGPRTPNSLSVNCAGELRQVFRRVLAAGACSATRWAEVLEFAQPIPRIRQEPSAPGAGDDGGQLLIDRHRRRIGSPQS